MKRTDLEKNAALKLARDLRGEGLPNRFGNAAATAFDKREQRRLDQAAGLVPFAVKLNGDLIKQLHALSQERQIGMNELVDELIRKGLS